MFRTIIANLEGIEENTTTIKRDRDFVDQLFLFDLSGLTFLVVTSLVKSIVIAYVDSRILIHEYFIMQNLML